MMPETAKAMQAFNDYYALGPNRSLDKLYEQYRERPKAEVPTHRRATLAQWSSAHGWQERVMAKDAEIALVQFEEIKRLAASTGYAVWQKRVWDLNRLAETLFEEVQDPENRWARDVKGIGRGKNFREVEIVRFNAPLVKEFRATLDDLAKEMGERVQGIAIAASVQVENLDEVRERRWAQAGPALRRALEAGEVVDGEWTEEDGDE